MKKIVFLLVMLFYVINQQYAQDTYRIVFLNTDSVCIGGKMLKVNDLFNSGDKINWTQGHRTIIKVVNTKTLTQHVIVSEKANNGKSLSSIFKNKNNHLSTRGGTKLNVISLQKILSNELILIDSLSFNTTLHTDATHYFYISYKYNGETINKKLIGSSNALVIDYNIYTIDSIKIRPLPINVNVYYYNQDNSERTLIKENVSIYPAIQ